MPISSPSRKLLRMKVVDVRLNGATTENAECFLFNDLLLFGSREMEEPYKWNGLSCLHYLHHLPLFSQSTLQFRVGELRVSTDNDSIFILKKNSDANFQIWMQEILSAIRSISTSSQSTPPTLQISSAFVLNESRKEKSAKAFSSHLTKVLKGRGNVDEQFEIQICQVMIELILTASVNHLQKQGMLPQIHLDESSYDGGKLSLFLAELKDQSIQAFNFAEKLLRFSWEKVYDENFRKLRKPDCDQFLYSSTPVTSVVVDALFSDVCFSEVLKRFTHIFCYEVQLLEEKYEFQRNRKMGKILAYELLQCLLDTMKKVEVDFRSNQSSCSVWWEEGKQRRMAKKIRKFLKIQKK